MTGKRWVLLSYGFRPFFLLTGVYALLSMAGWMVLYAGGGSPFGRLPPSLWHAHEMLFGFAGAAIAGFLLTAVPNWTGSQRVTGVPLLLLSIVWIVGRVGMILFGLMPVGAAIVMALLFVPGLCIAVGLPLLRTGRKPLLALIVAYWLSDVVFLLAVLQQSLAVARIALDGGIGIVLVLITLIGGRIVPLFTANSLRHRGLDVATPSTPQLDRLVLVAMLLYVVAGIVEVPETGMAAIAGSAATLQIWRFAKWQGHKTWPEPIVWVLHVAYFALPVGLMLRAMFEISGAVWAMHWQHVLTIGGAATMVMAVTTRASLGHTGRALRVATIVALGYAALVLAMLTRAFGQMLLPAAYPTVVMISGGLWVFAFAIYTMVYAPILVQPRAEKELG